MSGLEPVYAEHVDLILNKIEADPSRWALWNAICDTIDLICDRPDTAEARREVLRLPSGTTVWQVPIHCYIEDDNWVLLWHRDHDDAVILYIGPYTYK